MKQTRLLLFLAILLCSSKTFAESFTKDGFTFSTTSTTEVEVTGSETTTGALSIPASVTNGSNTYSVTSIKSSTFYDCSGLTSVTIPASIVSIKAVAFMGCTGLTAVNISDMAAWCKIDFSDYGNPLYYAKKLYLNGSEVTNLEIPSGITSIKAEFKRIMQPCCIPD